jgi:hypothetical protein
MGRPVFQTFTLDELVAASHVIFVGAWGEPKRRSDETTGAVYHCVRVVEVLDENPFIFRTQMASSEFVAPDLTSLASGIHVDILANRSRMQDVSLRRGPNSSGASFSARRYRTDQEVLNEDPLVFFALCSLGRLEEAADLSVERIERRADIEAAIARDRPLRDARKRAAAEHLEFVKQRNLSMTN